MAGTAQVAPLSGIRLVCRWQLTSGLQRLRERQTGCDSNQQVGVCLGMTFFKGDLCPSG